MKHNRSVFLFIAVLFFSCTASKKGDLSVSEFEGEAESGLTEKESKIATKEKLYELAVYSSCKNYDNNLSSFAHSVEFIPLPLEPLINDFQVCDIAFCNDRILLSGLSFIYQYDKTGDFIRQIGNRGMGPKEYVNISYPLQIDEEKSLIYATDLGRNRVVIFHIDGDFYKTIPLPPNSCIDLIDENLIALRQTIGQRNKPDCASIRFMDSKGKIINSYRSNIYPIKKKTKMLGADMSRVWRHKGNLYFLEYASDTLYHIKHDSIVPRYRLTGEFKLNQDDYFKKETGDKFGIMTYIMRPNSGIFESDNYIVFRMGNNSGNFFMVYDKIKSRYYRTYHKDAVANRTGAKNMDYFIDDMVSGLKFNPQYQNGNKAIAILSSETLMEEKQKMLDFISVNPTPEGEQLKSFLKQLSEDDNPYLIIVTFK